MFKLTGLHAAVVALLCLSASTAQEVVKLTEPVRVGAGETFDGQGKTYVSDGLGDGGQSENQQKLFRLGDGATLKNVRIGFPAADGVRVLGDATFINVHWDDVGEDAMSIGAVCGETTHTVVLEGCSMAKAEDKAFQVNSRANIFIRNFEANDIARFMAAGVPTTVTIENAIITGGPNARYFIRANAPSSRVYMKNTVVNWQDSSISNRIFYNMEPSQFVDEGGNEFIGEDGGVPKWRPRPSDQCGFNGGQPGGGARGTGVPGAGAPVSGGADVIDLPAEESPTPVEEEEEEAPATEVAGESDPTTETPEEFATVPDVATVTPPVIEETGPDVATDTPPMTEETRSALSSGGELWPPFPSPTGSVDMGGDKIRVEGGEVFDGGMKSYSGGQFRISEGSTLQNIIIENPSEDIAVHCSKGCTLKNVWWPNIGDYKAAEFQRVDGEQPGIQFLVDGGGVRGVGDRRAFVFNARGTLTMRNFQLDDFVRGILANQGGDYCEGDQICRSMVFENIRATGNRGSGWFTLFNNAKIDSVTNLVFDKASEGDFAICRDDTKGTRAKMPADAAECGFDPGQIKFVL